MDFIKVSSTLLEDFRRQNIHYSVIGGFALGFWGVTRATIDMDFLLLLDDADKADDILRRYQYRQTYRSENVARYESDQVAFGTIDIIYAFRDISKAMLSRSVTVKVQSGLSIQSLIPEDIIGLKVQAIANDPDREAQDIADIRALLATKKNNSQNTDWVLLESYFELFELENLFNELKESYGQT